MKHSRLEALKLSVTGNPQAERSLVFVHGFGTDQSVWGPMIEAFGADYRIICFDLAGASPDTQAAYDPERYPSLEAYANDVLEICESQQAKNAILVGHSVGGMIALLASLKAPDYFSALVMISGSPRYLNDAGYHGGFEQSDLDQLYRAMHENYQAWVSGFAPLAMGNAERPELAEYFASHLLTIRPDIAQSILRLIFQSDYRDLLGQVGHKTLLIHSREDIAVPKEVATYLLEKIPHAQLQFVEATGHLPHVSAPQKIIAALSEFLQKV